MGASLSFYPDSDQTDHSNICFLSGLDYRCEAPCPVIIIEYYYKIISIPISRFSKNNSKVYQERNLVQQNRWGRNGTKREKHFLLPCRKGEQKLLI
jgi:hypothetical protein